MIKRYLVNNQDHYEIDFQRQADGTYKMFALQYPHDPYGAPVSENHLYSSGEICVSSGKAPRTLDRAKAVAMVWMEGWSVYVRTGRFPKGNRRVNV